MRYEDIYESAFDDEAFAALPDKLAAMIGAKSSLIHWRDGTGGGEVFAYGGFSQAFVTAYAADYAEQDVWVRAGMEPQNQNILHNCSDVVGDDAYRNSFVYNEFVRSQRDDTFYCIGGAFSSRRGVGMIAVHRGRKQFAFESEDVATLQGHTSQLRQVLRFRSELSRARRKTGEILDTIGLCVIVVDDRRRISQINAAADVVLARRDALASNRNILRAARSDQTEQLANLVAQATAPDHPRSRSLSIGRTLGRAYLLDIVPMTGSGGRAMIIFRDPDTEDASLRFRLREFFGLSLVESDMAVRITAGETLSRITADRGVQLSTVKTQLLSTMAKMGCSRQVDIASRVASLPPLR